MRALGNPCLTPRKWRFLILLLIPLDTKGTSDGAKTAAQSGLSQGAELILGPVFAEEVKAVKPLAAQAQKSMIAFSTDWRLADSNTFMMGFLPFDQVERIKQYAASKGVNTVGTIFPQTDYGQAVDSTYQKSTARYRLKTTSTMRIPVPGGNTAAALRAFSNYDNRAKLEGSGLQAPLPFQAVFMPLSGDQAALIAAQAARIGMTNRSVKFMGTGLWDDAAANQEPALQGAWYAAPSPAQRAGFVERYKGLYGATPERLASLGYDAAALASVLAQNGLRTSGQPDFHAAAITNPNGFAGIDGIFRFYSNGLVERGLAVLEVRPGGSAVIEDAPRTFQRQSF